MPVNETDDEKNKNDKTKPAEAENAAAVSTPSAEPATANKEPTKEETKAEMKSQAAARTEAEAELSVTYYPDDNEYELSVGSDSVYVEKGAKDELKEDKKEYLEDLKEAFKSPTKVEIDNTIPDYAAAAYWDGENRITVGKNSDMSGEDIRQAIFSNYGINESDYTKEQKEEMAQEYQAIYMSSLMSHELTHRNDDKNGLLYTKDLSYGNSSKLDMATEIHANLTQASQALNYYRTTGRTEGFDMLWCCGKETRDNIVKYVTNPENKEKLGTDECKEYITQQVQQGWLKENNVAGSTYSNQARDSVIRSLANDDICHPGTNDKTTKREFNRRMKKMFSNVAGMGDVSAYIDCDFNLNEELQSQLETKYPSQIQGFVDKSVGNAKTAGKAANKLEKSLEKQFTKEQLSSGQVVTAIIKNQRGR